MKDSHLKATYIGGSTVLLEMSGLRLLTDPTSDAAAEAVDAAHAFAGAVIILLHYEGWAHFSESRHQIEDAFKAAAVEQQLRWLEPGRATAVTASWDGVLKAPARVPGNMGE